jgi:hypothetical protein
VRRSTVVDDAAQYLSIRFTRESLDEVDVDGTRLVCLPRDGITSVALVYGQSEERPLLQLVAGLVLVAVGLVFVVRILSWVLVGGNIVDLEAFGVTLVPLGAWFVYRVFRKRHYLRVETGKEVRKLAFNGKAQPEMIGELLERARRELGYPCQSK